MCNTKPGIESDRFMKLTKDNLSFTLCFTDEERAKWLDGSKLWWDLPKDDRPDWNPYEYDVEDDHHQIYYKLDSLAREFPLNKVPEEITEGLVNLQELEKICNDYMRHVLGLILKKRSNK